ncbi:hypothetical protein M231_04626 [Tremella mesenterica]|uniref:Uncharacterized protein n=2 Tax=Tremella mesenterica TaxID=5217 RepID=A0A4V1M3U3_TREME|nr:hypothetical protein M231_04626 [Tremella mesenterica]
MSLDPTQPKTMQYQFQTPVLQAHFQKSPNPDGAIRLIDQPEDEFVETEEEMNVIAGALYILAVKWDKLPEAGKSGIKDEDARPKNREALRKWIIQQGNIVIDQLANKVEPPFAAWSIDQIQKDVRAMVEELILKAMPVETKVVDGSKKPPVASTK